MLYVNKNIKLNKVEIESQACKFLFARSNVYHMIYTHIYSIFY